MESQSFRVVHVLSQNFTEEKRRNSKYASKSQIILHRNICAISASMLKVMIARELEHVVYNGNK